jgi:hypothetical protein
MIGTEDIRSILDRSRHKNVRRLRNWFENKVMAAFQINTVPVGFVMVIPLEAGAR